MNESELLVDEEFNEEYLNSLIKEALNEKGENLLRPISQMHLSFAETDLLSLTYNYMSKELPQSELNTVFQKFRSEIISRKLSMTPKEIHTVTRNCKKCNIPSQAELPKWNVVNPDLVIVIESPSIESNAIDLMISSIKSAGFSSENLCLTYVNRCPKYGKYDNKEIINCSPYLHTEIQLLNPKLILTMGGLPTSVLFGTSIKIKDYRGNIVWLGYWPILPTYSPGYVLKSGSNSIEQFNSDIVKASQFINQTKKEAS